MFSQVCTKNAVHRGVYPSMHWGRHPPQTYTSPGQTPQPDTPLGRHPLTDTPHCSGRTVCILLECFLVGFDINLTGRYFIIHCFP